MLVERTVMPIVNGVGQVRVEQLEMHDPGHIEIGLKVRSCVRVDDGVNPRTFRRVLTALR